MSSAKDLATRERDLWGGVGNDEGSRSRSPVEFEKTASQAPLAA